MLNARSVVTLASHAHRAVASEVTLKESVVIGVGDEANRTAVWALRGGTAKLDRSAVVHANERALVALNEGSRMELSRSLVVDTQLGGAHTDPEFGAAGIGILAGAGAVVSMRSAAAVRERAQDTRASAYMLGGRGARALDTPDWIRAAGRSRHPGRTSAITVARVNRSPREAIATEPAFDGDPSWTVERELRDGTKITIRPITPEDREPLRIAFERASLRTRYLRFMDAKTELTEEALTYLTCVDQVNHVAVVAVAFSPDLKAERGVGVARFIRVEDAEDTVEAAITVADDMQNKGVGTALAYELERAAQLRGIRWIRAEVLASNVTMRAILDEAGARLVTPTEAKTDRAEGMGTITYEIEVDPAPLLDRVMTVLRGAARSMGMM